MKGSLFIVTAASGTGKTSLVKQLIATTNDLAVSVSHTTRDPRPGEVDGQHYHFTDTTKFVEGIQAGEFLEHAQVFDNYYGTSRQSVDQQLNSGVDVILEIDWQGALQIKELYDDVTMIFYFAAKQSHFTSAPLLTRPRLSRGHRKTSGRRGNRDAAVRSF